MKKIIPQRVKAFCKTQKKVTANTPLEDLDLDSLSFVALLISFEEEFGVAWEDEEFILENYPLVGHLAKAVEEKQKAGRGKEGRDRNYGCC